MGQGRRDNKMPVCWEDQRIDHIASTNKQKIKSMLKFRNIEKKDVKKIASGQLLNGVAGI